MTRRHYTHSLFLSFLAFLCLPFWGTAQVSIKSNLSAAVLAQELAGSGVTILNPVFSGDVNAAGVFSARNSGLGIDSGILLCTGIASDVSGNSSKLASTNNGRLGDIQLNALARASTHDAVVLEFDIVPKNDTLRFEYLFGSEEYINATCGPYNDAFAFFISGPGISASENMALVPGTNIAVTVNSINNGIPGPTGNIVNCTSLGPGSPFTSLYIDNQNGTSITYQGYTKVLSATRAVTPCDTYHLKIVIADAGNSLYDSGVFLKANSIRANSYHIAARNRNGSTPATIAFGCNDAIVTVSRDERKSSSQIVSLRFGGDAQIGTDFSNISNSVVFPPNADSVRFIVNAIRSNVGGQKRLVLYLFDPQSCSPTPEIIDSVVIKIVDAPSLSFITPDTTICARNVVQLQCDGTPGMLYEWRPKTGLKNGNTKSPTAMPQSTTKYFVNATLTELGCPDVVDSVLLTVLNGPAVDAGQNQTICERDSVTLNASTEQNQIAVSYTWTGPQGFFDSGNVIRLNALQANQGGYYVVHVLGASNGCLGQDSVLIHLRPSPAEPSVISPLLWCVNGPATALTASGVDLLWYTDSVSKTGSKITPVPALNAEGVFRYFVTQNRLGCESRRAEILLKVIPCCARELVVPSAFTPNGDSRNDAFKILGGDEGTSVDFRIFNRWGESVFHGLGREAWDGTYGGKPAPAGTYFYIMQVDCHNGTKSIKKGTVDLLR